jgi:hypothetical protein
MGKRASWISAVLHRVRARVPTPVKYYLVARWRFPREHEFFSRREEAEIPQRFQSISRSTGRLNIWILSLGTWFSGPFQGDHQMALALARALRPRLHTLSGLTERYLRRLGWDCIPNRWFSPYIVCIAQR